jgi:Rrf2 family protein
MRLSARVDYALRAAAELAAAGEGPTTVGELAKGQEMPPKYLENILLQMRRAGLVRGQRGPEGGYVLARPAGEISLADVIRAVDGPLANVRGERPEHVGYTGAAQALQQVWIALRASERAILEEVTLEQIAKGDLPPRVTELSADPSAWDSHMPV